MSGAFGSAILEVAIGLVFIYLMLAIIVSIVNEFIAQAVALRAKTLEQGLRRLLQGAAPPDTNDWVTRLYQHPLISGMSSTTGTLKPSYIASRHFALALLDLVTSNATPSTSASGGSGADAAGGAGMTSNAAPGTSASSTSDYRARLETGINNIQDEHLKRALLSLSRGAQGDVNALQKNIEDWFNDAMDRVSGWYKRKVRLIVLALGALLTLLLNADTLGIAQTLWTNPTLRAGVVAAAQDYEQQSSEADLAKRLDNISTAFNRPETSGIPLGWRDLPSGWGIPRAILGLTLTVLAVSLGAPFWFDVLNRVMTFRSAGKPPPKVPSTARHE